MMKRVIKAFQNNGVILGFIFMMVVAVMINRSFLSLENLTNVLRQASMNGMIAVGMTMVILCGSIDLSVGTMLGFSGYIALYLSNYSLMLAVFVPLLMGLVIGAVNAFLINKVKMASFIATLATMTALKGTTLIMTNENTYFAKNSVPAFSIFGRGALFQYITMPAVMFICAAVIGNVLLNRTPLGRSMYAVGGNQEAARMMGINVERTMLAAHMITGFLAALAGITLVSRVGAAYPLAGEGKELDVIAACVIGGTALTGGKGKISGTFVGVLIMGLLTNIFNMQTALNSFWEKVITGSLVLVVVLIQSIHENHITLWSRKEKNVTIQ